MGLTARKVAIAAGAVAMAVTLAAPAEGVTRRSAFIVPTWGVLSSPAGWRLHPVSNRWRMHWGIDIAAPMGTPVVASAAGVVTSAGVARGHGKFVVIAHGGGWVTVYSHLSVIGVATGARVAQGQWIGRVGRTGVATGPHLHFEVWHRGSPVDPLWALGLRP